MEFLESEATDQNLQEIPSGKENLEIRPWISLVVASSSIFLMTLDLGLTAVSLPEIRADFAETIDANAVHGSDSTESAAREISYFFDDSEIF